MERKYWEAKLKLRRTSYTHILTWRRFFLQNSKSKSIFFNNKENVEFFFDYFFCITKQYMEKNYMCIQFNQLIFYEFLSPN
ncbi:hypothetical protein BpHYR1_008005 [Brachionus plicatilis]|uniref:Uncharacterized protein n=1 Tax=Brachionus plicatilis TaxID=10195 RepID=A0A3M7R3B7_BRAPC|nr:hypothetical protein BpHYR1_008005 [Brachionus plicatilis]